MAQTTPSEVAGAKGEAPFAVLVIDGNEEHQILSVAALTRKGWIVRTAASGKQGLQLAIAHHFDAILVGSKLRDATGIEVVRLLGERVPDIPKIFVVPPEGEEAALRALQSGALSYIVKTPRYTELLPAVVEEHIVESRNRRRLAESEQIQAQNLTERKEVEERLSNSERRLKMILEQAPVLLWSTDKELRVTSATGGGFRSLDLPPTRERGLTLFEYFNIPDEDLEPIASHRRALAGESVATQIEWQGRTFDVHIEPLRSPDRTVIGTIGMAFDVSERTRTEESLRRSEERFHLLGRATNDVVWDWDLQTDGMWMNENVTKVFGYLAEEVEPMGAWWANHLHPADKQRVVTGIEEVIRSGGTSWSSEYRFRRRDGTYATVVDRGYVLHDATGHPLRLIGSAMDVTRQRKAEAIQSAVYRISEAANTAKDLPDLYGPIHKVIGGLMPASNFYIALHAEGTGMMEFPYFVDEEESPPPPQKLGRGLTEYVLRTGRPLLASPKVFDDLVAKGEVVSVGPPSVDWLGAPLVCKGTTIGVIVVQSYTAGVRFAEEDKAILNFVSEQVAMAIDRKRTEEHLRQTSSEIDAIFRAVPDLYFRLAADGTILGYYAGRLADLYVPPESFLGRRISEILPRDVGEPLARAIQKVLHTKSLATMEYALDVPAGRKEFEARVMPLLNDQLVVIVRDITEKKATEAALQTSVDRYRPLFEANPLPMWVFDHETLRILAVNEAAVHHYGFSREEFLAMTIAKIRPPEDVAGLMEALANRPEGFSRAGVWRHRKKDGTIIQVEISSNAMTFDGRSAQLVLAHDVTEQRRAEAAVKESNEALLALFDASPVAISALDREGRVMSWNPAAERIFGWKASDVVGRPLPTVPHGLEAETTRMWATVLDGGNVAGVETRGLRKDGTAIDVSVSSSPLRDAKGEIRGLMAVFEEITLRKSMEGRLTESQRLASMGQLAGFIAHELNTPLTSISLLTTAVTRRVTDESALEKLEKINTERRRAAGIIRELLSLSKIRELHAIETDLRSVVAPAVELARRLRKKGVRLETDVGDVPVRLTIDPLQIQDVVVNLVENALDATSTGFVRVRVEERPESHAIVVSDSGPGMSKETLSHLFEPFFTSKSHGEGIGLGLLVSKHVVTNHGGTIEVASEPGKGSTFTVLLPRRAAP